jgi:predicted TIM-barrel fold metal-dependent hydrolase
MMTNKLCWQERMAHIAALATLVSINQASASAKDIQYRADPNPNFSSEMVAQLLDDAVKRGARGLKVLKDWGLGVKEKSGKLVSIDDPRMDPVWEECGRLGIPVAIHSTDPEAFFTPTDAKNERYEELMHNPSWSFYGAAFPAKQQLLEQRNHVVAKHPHTTFVALHVANWPENLDTVSDRLRQYPIGLSRAGKMDD